MMHSVRIVAPVGAWFLTVLVAGTAWAQEVREPFEAPPLLNISVQKLPGPAERLPERFRLEAAGQDGAALPRIMLTGYWPPTNEMLRQFSTNPDQNPAGWSGGDWEGRGYDILAFFPEFPGGTLGRGVGDFEVDYQDTSNDWWPLVAELRPIAIVTTSRATTVRGWELEGGHRKYALSAWTPDYLSPTRPTPELPIAAEPDNRERFSSLPMQAIVAAVADSGALVDPFIAPFDDGRFLSNYIGYHGCWYHDLHSDRSDPDWNIAAGHIHVGSSAAVSQAVIALEATLRALIDELDRRRGLSPASGDMNCDGQVNFDDLEGFVTAVIGAAAYESLIGDCRWLNADIDASGSVDFDDIEGFVGCLVTGVCG